MDEVSSDEEIDDDEMGQGKGNMERRDSSPNPRKGSTPPIPTSSTQTSVPEEPVDGTNDNNNGDVIKQNGSTFHLVFTL